MARLPAGHARVIRAGVFLILAAIVIAASFKEARADQPGQAITAYSDGSSQDDLTYTSPGRKEIYVSVPADWTVASATMDLHAAAYGVAQTDQKNEATRYEGTWGVRAQQFRPSESELTSVELFLARASSKPGDLTVEIREDDGQGHPSNKVLTSVTKAVNPGGYRWEQFSFPEVEVEPGQLYWIVNYAGSLNNATYPAVPLIGEYGFYLGMSLNDEYPSGDSADFLAFPSGSRWEKYPSRKSWDLLFRTHGMREYFPSNLTLVVGDDDARGWHYPGELKDTAVVDFTYPLTEYIRTHQNTASGGEITIPLAITSDSPGHIALSALKIVRGDTPPQPNSVNAEGSSTTATTRPIAAPTLEANASAKSRAMGGAPSRTGNSPNNDWISSLGLLVVSTLNVLLVIKELANSSDTLETRLSGRNFNIPLACLFLAFVFIIAWKLIEMGR